MSLPMTKVAGRAGHDFAFAKGGRDERGDVDLCCPELLWWETGSANVRRLLVDDRGLAAVSLVQSHSREGGGR